VIDLISALRSETLDDWLDYMLNTVLQEMIGPLRALLFVLRDKAVVSNVSNFVK
jgi:hypothetical protein